MANLNAYAAAPFLSEGLVRTQHCAQALNFTSQAAPKSNVGLALRRKRKGLPCSATHAGEMSLVDNCGFVEDKYLMREYGWGVRRMVTVGEEMRSVAHVQAEAFHVPVLLFNDLFYEFFRAEVLSALTYKVRNSPPDRYACLVAESLDASEKPQPPPARGLVGVVDVTVQRDEDVVMHLKGVDEYVYVSGIAVLRNYRRQKVATAMLKACDVLSDLWGFKYLALRAYEDDSAAQKLYRNAGYRVVSGDPHWITLTGKKRRLLMIKQTDLRNVSYDLTPK